MSGVIGKNTGAPINSNLMRKLVGKAHGIDTSHIKVIGETKDAGGNGLKPTKEEFDKWQRGEDITPESKSNAPIINLENRTRNTMSTLLRKQAAGTTPAPASIPELPKQMIGGLRESVNDNLPGLEFKYNPNAPIPDLDASYARAAKVVAGVATTQQRPPSDLPVPSRTAGGDAATFSVNEEAIAHELPSSRLKRLLTTLGEAMVESAGGKYGVSDVYAFNGITYKITFQHRLMESSSTTGIQIDVNLSDGISTTNVTVTLPEGSGALMQTLSRHYIDANYLIEDLTNLIEAAGQHV